MSSPLLCSQITIDLISQVLHFVRVGSESIKASESQFQELIASRIAKVRPLLEAKRNDEVVSVCVWLFGFNERGIPGIPEDYTVVECTPPFVVFRANGGGIISGDYDRMRLSRTPDGKQLRVEIEGG
jgi:hypothetical protein